MFIAQPGIHRELHIQCNVRLIIVVTFTSHSWTKSLQLCAGHCRRLAYVSRIPPRPALWSYPTKLAALKHGNHLRCNRASACKPLHKIPERLRL